MQREITRELVRRLLPGRMAESNKGSYGSVLAAAGSMAYRGAAALCTEGALRGGAGLVYLASVEPVIQLVLSRTPECCACGCRTAANGGIHPQDATALIVGGFCQSVLDELPMEFALEAKALLAVSLEGAVG